MQLQGYELPARALAAALTHAAKNDVRYYLNAVFLDFQAGRIVGTDGHRMFIGQIPTADCPSVIVPRDQAEQIVKAAKKELKKGCYVVVNVGPESVPEITIKSVLSGASVTAQSVNGKYPDYARVLPNPGQDEAPGSYNAVYLLGAQKALAIYTGRDTARTVFAMRQHGERGPCLITANGKPAFCIVMPMRTPAVDPVADIAWFYNSIKKAA